MKCAVLSELGQPLKLETRADPEPGEGELCIELHAAALNRRDYWITQGMYPGIRLPVVLGSDGAGVVIRAGAGANARWVGQAVVINPGWDWGDDSRVQGEAFRIVGMPDDGTLATHIVVPEQYVAVKPPDYSWREAAALPLAGVTAYRACFTRGGVGSGDRVLITGIGGGVATMALQLARAAGASVAVTSSSGEKLERARGLGADAGFLYTDAEWADRCRREFGRPSLIIDGAGGAGYSALVELLAPGGRLVNYGATAGAPQRLDLFKVFWKQLDLRGTTMGSPDEFDRLLVFVREHGVRPVIDEVFGLSRINDALDRLAGKDHFGKVVIDCAS